jgi:hypothetical protein
MRFCIVVFSILIFISSSSAFAIAPSSILGRGFPYYFSWLPRPKIIRIPLPAGCPSARIKVRTSYWVPESPGSLLGSDQSFGFVSEGIAEQLVDREFRDLNSFTRSFWKAVARSPHGGEFSVENYDRMNLGRAPIAPEFQQVDGQAVYQIHWIGAGRSNPTEYDLTQYIIASPRYVHELQQDQRLR